MDKILGYIETYGLAIIVIAVCIIAIIGILKLCKVFDKIKSSEIKKLIYYALDVALAFAGSAIYFAGFHKAWSGYWLYSLAQLGVTTTLYALYENFGLRKFVQWLISIIAGWFKKNPNNELSKWANKVGLTESLETIQNMIAEQDAKKETTEVSSENQESNVENVEVVIEETKDTNATNNTNNTSTTNQIQF